MLGADTLAQIIHGTRTSMIDVAWALVVVIGVAQRCCSWSRGTSLPWRSAHSSVGSRRERSI
jgi:hypothetical protein